MNIIKLMALIPEVLPGHTLYRTDIRHNNQEYVQLGFYIKDRNNRPWYAALGFKHEYFHDVSVNHEKRAAELLAIEYRRIEKK